MFDGTDYLKFAFRLNKHIKGIMTTDTGSSSIIIKGIRRKIDKEPIICLKELKKQNRDLILKIKEEVKDANRKQYLIEQLKALDFLISDSLEAKSYQEFVKGLFQINIKKFKKEEIQKKKDELNNLINDAGYKNLESAIKKEKLKRKEVLKLVKKLLLLFRKKTKAILSLLPRNEKIKVKITKNKPWNAFNHYKNNYKSLLEINLDCFSSLSGLKRSLAHEVYPGHHTEACIKEKLLVNKRGYLEQLETVLNTPTCVISEGIARLGYKFLFEESIVDKNRKILKLLATLRGMVYNNALLMKWEKNKNKKQIVNYLCKEGLYSAKTANQSYKFIADPFWKGYAAIYFLGENLIDRYYKKAKRFNKLKEFYNMLYTKQLTPNLFKKHMKILFKSQ